MKILVTGRTGQVGSLLERALEGLGELRATGRDTLDFTAPDSVRRIVRELRPDLIINAAAYTAVDRAESDAEVAMAVNGVVPGVLAEEAKALGAMLVHYSTDYVFDGAKAGAYLEDDSPSPVNEYGRTKLEGERRVRASGCRHLLIRTSWVYGPRGRNFFLAIAAKAQTGEALRVVADQRGVPTSSAYLAESTRALLEQGAEGLVNVVPSGETTWYGFASAIVERLGQKVSVEPIRSADFPSAARRPTNSVLDIGRLTRLLGPRASWEQGLERCVRQYRQA